MASHNPGIGKKGHTTHSQASRVSSRKSKCTNSICSLSSSDNLAPTRHLPMDLLTEILLYFASPPVQYLISVLNKEMNAIFKRSLHPTEEQIQKCLSDKRYATCIVHMLMDVYAKVKVKKGHAESLLNFTPDFGAQWDPLRYFFRIGRVDLLPGKLFFTRCSEKSEEGRDVLISNSTPSNRFSKHVIQLCCLEACKYGQFHSVKWLFDAFGGEIMKSVLRRDQYACIRESVEHQQQGMISLFVNMLPELAHQKEGGKPSKQKLQMHLTPEQNTIFREYFCDEASDDPQLIDLDKYRNLTSQHQTHRLTEMISLSQHDVFLCAEYPLPDSTYTLRMQWLERAHAERAQRQEEKAREEEHREQQEQDVRRSLFSKAKFLEQMIQRENRELEEYIKRRQSSLSRSPR